MTVMLCALSIDPMKALKPGLFQLNCHLYPAVSQVIMLLQAGLRDQQIGLSEVLSITKQATIELRYNLKCLNKIII